MLAFIGYAWSGMLCATAVRLRTVVCVAFFGFFIVPGPVCFWSSATTGVLVHVHPAENAYPKGYFLSVERGSDPWYHVWYVVCYSSPSTYGRVRSFFSVLLSYLVMSAFDRRPLLAYSYTYNQQRMLTPRVISSLSSVVVTHGIPNGPLSPECLLYVQRISASFFFSRLFHTYVLCDMMYLHHTASK